MNSLPWDYVILHRGALAFKRASASQRWTRVRSAACYCFTEGNAPDSIYASYLCSICEEEFGFGTPIIMDEGRLIEHMSCRVQVIEQTMGRDKGWRNP